MFPPRDAALAEGMPIFYLARPNTAGPWGLFLARRLDYSLREPGRTRLWAQPIRATRSANAGSPGWMRR
jgi:hypothetical protein